MDNDDEDFSSICTTHLNDKTHQRVLFSLFSVRNIKINQKAFEIKGSEHALTQLAMTKSNINVAVCVDESMNVRSVLLQKGILKRTFQSKYNSKFLTVFEESC